MQRELTRRRLLAGSVAAGAAGLAGCLGGDEGAAEATGTGDGSRLAYVRVANWDATAHTVHVLVERGGDIVHWSAHDLPGTDDRIPTETLPSSWAEESGRFVVSVRVDDSESWESFDVTAQTGDCFGVEARVTDDGGQSLWYERNPDACATGRSG